MRDHLYNKDILSSPARRHFLHVISAVASAAAVVPSLLTSASAQGLTRSPPLPRPSPTPSPRPNPGCLLRGTHILTPHGLRQIESLSIGDHVMTAGGEAKPIKWIGRQIFRRSASLRWPDSVHPICVAQSALADNVPHANLYLSPLHALFIDGVLIQVAPLVNGTSITPAVPTDMTDIEYFQIELTTHEVIVAEGAPVETHLNTNGREHFTNFVEYERLYGRETGPTVPYAPVYGYSNARAHFKALLRLGISHVVDVRDPIQRTYDRIAARGTDLALSV
jgi:Hint domain